MQALGDEIGRAPSTISEWETGLYSPSNSSLRLLSPALRIPAATLARWSLE